MDLKCQINEANAEIKTLKTESEVSQRFVNDQLDICKAHIRSLVCILTDLFEYILTK